jgi:orotate phosphoribosyltransferase
VIVRSRAKEYGTANRIEGAFDYGDCVCLVEDVVTSGGAAIEAVEALREAGLRVSNAVCVVDREEGGVDALARVAVRLRALFTGSQLREVAAKPHG